VLSHVPAAPGGQVKYRVQLKSGDEKVAINVAPVSLGMTFSDGGRVKSVSAGSQAAIQGIKPDWLLVSVAGQNVDGRSEADINAAIRSAIVAGVNYTLNFSTPKVLSIRADNVVRVS